MKNFEEIYDDNQGANPLDIRRELLGAVGAAVDKAFACGVSGDSLVAVVKTDAIFAAKTIFDKYFIR